MFSIRAASPSDIPLIRELTMQVWPHTYNHIIGEQQVAYMLQLFYAPEVLKQQMDEQNHYFITAYSGDEPVAFAAYAETGPGIYKLHKLYILPSQQGKGIGRYLIGYITDDIKGKGGTLLLLNVNRHNHPAKTFYQKAGFRHIVDEDINIGNGYFMNDHVLGLVLDS